MLLCIRYCSPSLVLLLTCRVSLGVGEHTKGDTQRQEDEDHSKVVEPTTSCPLFWEMVLAAQSWSLCLYVCVLTWAIVFVSETVSESVFLCLCSYVKFTSHAGSLRDSLSPLSPILSGLWYIFRLGCRVIEFVGICKPPPDAGLQDFSVGSKAEFISTLAQLHSDVPRQHVLNALCHEYHFTCSDLPQFAKLFTPGHGQLQALTTLSAHVEDPSELAETCKAFLSDAMINRCTALVLLSLFVRLLCYFLTNLLHAFSHRSHATALMQLLV